MALLLLLLLSLLVSVSACKPVYSNPTGGRLMKCCNADGCFFPSPFLKETEEVQDLLQSTFCLKCPKEQIYHRICSIEPEKESKSVPGQLVLRLLSPWPVQLSESCSICTFPIRPISCLPLSLPSSRRGWSHLQFPGHSYS